MTCPCPSGDASTMRGMAFDEAFTVFWVALFIAAILTQNAEWSLVLAAVAAGVTYVLTLAWASRRSTPGSPPRRNDGSSPPPA